MQSDGPGNPIRKSNPQEAKLLGTFLPGGPPHHKESLPSQTSGDFPWADRAVQGALKPCEKTIQAPFCFFRFVLRWAEKWILYHTFPGESGAK